MPSGQTWAVDTCQNCAQFRNAELISKRKANLPLAGCDGFANLTDINSVDFAALKKAGIKGVVFDKDNCLTSPYESTVHPQIKDAVDSCRTVFGDRWDYPPLLFLSH